MDTQRGDQSTQSAGLMFVGNLGRSWVGAWACACGKANVTVRFLLSDRAVTLPLLIRYVSEDEIVAGVQRSFLRACLVSSNCAEFNWIPESTLFGSLWNQTTNFNWFPTGRIYSPPRILKKNVGNLRILNAITMQSLVPDSVPFLTPPTAPTDPRRHPPLSTRAVSPSTGDEEERVLPSSVVGTSGLAFHRKSMDVLSLTRSYATTSPASPPRMSCAAAHSPHAGVASGQTITKYRPNNLCHLFALSPVARGRMAQ
jgi:hypothetical protein